MSRLVPALVAAVLVSACGGGYAPRSAQEIIDKVVAADLVDCDEQRSPFPDVITCVDPAGELTFALTDDGPARMATVSGPGPHLAGATWVVLSFDDDLERIEAVRDLLGDGVVYVRDADGDLQPQ